VGSAWAISSAAKMDEAISVAGRGQWAISSAAKMDEAIAAAVDFGILRGRWFHFRRRVVESGVCKCIL
jgi:hypothetical protein